MENNTQRVIKFRAWHKHEKQWAKELPFYIATGFNSDACFEVSNDPILDWMQFTGLHDKNGKEIYEGDCIKRGGIGVSIVSFAEGAFILDEGDGEPLSHYNHDEWEVIGNIYENPELLK